MYFLRFAYPYLFYFFVPIYVLAFMYRLKFYKSPIYSFSLATFLKNKKITKNIIYKNVLFLLRSLILILLIFLIARPQWVDSRSKINVEGVDIVLAIDISGSMQIFDDLRDKRSRIDVAKSEAIRFIEKRPDDPIGIVVFAKDALSRCPLTLDKNILKQVVGELKLGFINSDGTSLGTGLSIAVNRLRDSKSKSKIIILLTDGQPTPEQVDPDTAIDLAKKFGVKVYTVGIGNKSGGYAIHPLYGAMQANVPIDVKLLEKIAAQTGGRFFRANNPKEMRDIYDKIDALEKTEYQTDIFHRYYEAFLSFVWFLLILLSIELILKFVVWRGIGS
ncbi:VWA domain-containing protein [Candidatus Dependentiae bacterium]|nr:VWA domain-containing protein [Candidatus Dependentiae bacterium]